MKKKLMLLFSIVLTLSFATFVKANSENTTEIDSKPEIISEDKSTSEPEITEKATKNQSENIKLAETATKTSDPEPEPAVSPAPVQEQIVTPTSEPAQAPAPEPVQTPAPAPAPIDNTPLFTVTDYISECNNVNCFTSKDAERGVVQYRSTFYYGHSSIAFDRLKTVYEGDIIKVKDANGVVRTYQIAVREVKAKSYLNGDGKKDGYTAGVYSGKRNGIQYSASFMTCGNGGNNDSNYRLILFANEI